MDTSSSPTKTIKLVCMSDSHTRHREVKVPDGDIFIHCGDFAQKCPDDSQILEFNDWLGTLPHKHKLVIAGNHEYLLDKIKMSETQKRLLYNCTYLQDTGTEIEGVKIWGTPWNGSRFMSFGLPAEQRQAKWDLIPTDTELLITHMPPRGVRDMVGTGGLWGCKSLLQTLLDRVKPKLHLFGHVHEGYGVEFSLILGTHVANCATVLDPTGPVVRAPIVIDYQPGKGLVSWKTGA